MTYQVSETQNGAEQRISSIVGQIEGHSSVLKERTSEWGRLLKAATGWPWQPEQWVSLSAVLLAGLIGFWLMLIQVGSGDYGQWLMVSRAYLGQEVPGYRDISSVPPITPMGLAIVNVFTGSPIAALQIFKGILAFSFVISVYYTGKSIFRSAAAGLLSTVIAFLVADRMLELFAFGGLPQITAMIFMVASVGFAARAARQANVEWKWWAGSALMVGLAATSHVGTGLIAVFISIVIVAGALAINRQWSWRERSITIAPFAVIGIGLLAYYIPVLLPANESYASNPASEAYRGPDRIWAAYGLYFPNWAVIATGSVFILAAAYRSYATRHIEDSYVSILWAIGAWGFLFLTVLSGSATDYPRFTAPLLIPMAVAAGGGLAMAVQPAHQLLRYRYQKAALAGIPIFAAVTLVFAVGFNTAGQHNEEASFYALPTMDSVRDISTWLQNDNTDSLSVVAPTREGKWIEGLSGSPALINIPVRFSFRDSELERSVANETMLRSVSSLVNEQFFVKFIDAKEGAGSLVPVSAWIGANHGGEYVDLLRQPTSSTRVFTGGGTDDLLATLGALSAIDVTVDEGSESRRITTTWIGARRGEQVNFTRSYEIESGSPHFTVTDSASSELGISGIQSEVLPVSGVNVESIMINDTGALITFPMLGSTKPKIQVTSDDATVEFSLGDNGLVATSETSALSLTYTILDHGQALHQLDYLTPEVLIERFDIGYVVLENNSSTSARADRLSGTGFFPVYFSGPYTVLGLEGPFLTSFPEPEIGTESPETGGQLPNVALPTPTPVLAGAPSEPGEPTATPAPGSTVTPTPSPSPTPAPTVTPTPVPPPPEMIQAALWAFENGISAADILVSARESDGDWLTELTNATSLSLGVISAADDPEKVRQRVIADSLLRSYAAFVNENFSLKFVDSKSSGELSAPRQLWAAGNANGEYEALMRILPTDSRVISDSGDPTDLLATLNSLDPTDMTVVEDDNEVRITTVWQGERRGGTVEYRRTVVLTAGAADFEVIDEVTGTAPIGGIEAIVRAPAGTTYVNVGTDANGAIAELETTGETPLVFNVTSADTGTAFESRDGGIAVISSSPNRLHMRISMPVTGDAITELQSLVPMDVVEEMDIRAIFLRRDDAFSAREKRMNNLGFTTVAEFGSLVVMTREVSE